jgi:hypothetical protein
MTTTVRQIRKNKLSETRRLSEADARPQAISTYCTNLRAAPWPTAWRPSWASRCWTRSASHFGVLFGQPR